MAEDKPNEECTKQEVELEDLPIQDENGELVKGGPTAVEYGLM